MIEFTDDELMFLYRTAREACYSPNLMVKLEWMPVYEKTRAEIIRRMKEQKNT